MQARLIIKTSQILNLFFEAETLIQNQAAISEHYIKFVNKMESFQ